MDFVIVCLVALGASGLTLFSGFGLGTLLLPAFLLFFPADLAVAMTALVHFLNNTFKLILLGRHADRSVAIRFGIPAIVASFVAPHCCCVPPISPQSGPTSCLGPRMRSFP